jgi:quercetin dioxygenase-like cupin family protein
MTQLVRLWTDDDGESHFSSGPLDVPPHVATRIHSQITPPHGSLSWHAAPCWQYVITLTGTLRFTTRSAATFVIATGDVLLAADTTGGGHRWELIDDQPWTRIYVELAEQPAVPGRR